MMEQEQTIEQPVEVEQKEEKVWVTRMPPEELIKWKSKLDPNFLELNHLIRHRLRNDWDLVIGITGRCGTGKSNLSKWMGFLVDDKFDLIENVAYLPYPEEIKPKFKKLERYQMFDVDECSKGIHKHGWQNKVQQEVAQMYDTERYENKCTTMIMPRFKNFAENFRNYRIDIWINVIYRSKKKGKGIAIAYMIDTDKDIEDPWHMKENIKLKMKKLKNSKVAERTTKQILEIERRTKNYLFDFEFPPLPKELDRSYKHFKKLSRMQDKHKEKTKRKILKFDKTVQNMIVCMIEKKNMTQVEIAKEMGISNQEVSKIYSNARENN